MVSLTIRQSSRVSKHQMIGRMIKFRKSDSGSTDEVPSTVEQWKSIVEKAIDEMPWFGVSPYQPTVSKNPRQDPHSKIYYDRRILISWLAGRPVSEMAKRGGCSTRYVYEVLDRILYKIGYTEQQQYWGELGLFTVLDAPFYSDELSHINFEVDGYGTGSFLEQIDHWAEDYQPSLGVCLICHRVVTLLLNDYAENNLEQIQFDSYSSWLTPTKLESIMGHMACHFYLEGQWSLASLFGPKNRFPGKLGSLKLGDYGISQIYDWFMGGTRPFTPVIKGKSMDVEDARRWWLGLLNGKDALPKS